MPSNTGAPGGKRTGGQMTHYVLEGGPFDRAFRAMDAGLLLPWTSGNPGGKSAPKPKPESKLKYTCPGCGANAWGKPDLHIVCGGCEARLVHEGAEGRPPTPDFCVVRTNDDLLNRPERSNQQPMSHRR